MLYVDSSVLLARYLDEPESDEADRLLVSDATRVTASLTEVEVRRNLARALDGGALRAARSAFMNDLSTFHVVQLDRGTIGRAATIAEGLGVRSLDALHLGAAQRVADGTCSFATFDLRQAQAARSLGFVVVGA